jgi:hypothetical protein
MRYSVIENDAVVAVCYPRFLTRFSHSFPPAPDEVPTSISFTDSIEKSVFPRISVFVLLPPAFIDKSRFGLRAPSRCFPLNLMCLSLHNSLISYYMHTKQ